MINSKEHSWIYVYSRCFLAGKSGKGIDFLKIKSILRVKVSLQQKLQKSFKIQQEYNFWFLCYLYGCKFGKLTKNGLAGLFFTKTAFSLDNDGMNECQQALWRVQFYMRDADGKPKIVCLGESVYGRQ